MTPKRSPEELASLVGQSGDPFEFVVERGKIREFARATKCEHPAYVDDPEPVITPTFLATAAHWAPHEAVLLERTGWDRRRMLHATQEYAFPGPLPRAGTRLRGVTRIDSAFLREGRRGGALRFVVLATEFTDEEGGVVAIAKTTVVETSHLPGETP